MAKWYGKVGYAITKEIEPGIWTSEVIERPYYGDTIKVVSKWVTSNNVNDNLDLSSQISMVSDPFAYQNFQSIKYVEFMGSFWEVSSVEPQHPRLILTIGGVYNGQRPDPAITE